MVCNQEVGGSSPPQSTTPVRRGFHSPVKVFKEWRHWVSVDICILGGTGDMERGPFPNLKKRVIGFRGFSTV